MGRILAIDFGMKNIGLAISDELKIVAQRLPGLKVKSTTEALEGIELIVKSLADVEKIVMGLPLGPDFEPTPMSEKIKNFASKLVKLFDNKIQITFTNEVLSSKQAEAGKSRSFKKIKSHSESARIFLQEYLEHTSAK